MSIYSLQGQDGDLKCVNCEDCSDILVDTLFSLSSAVTWEIPCLCLSSRCNVYLA